MNQHLKKAFEIDTRKKKRLIAPISEDDANIVWEIIIALGKIDDAETLKNILDDYKYMKDRDIYESLLQWNIEHPEGFKETEGDEDKKGRKFIEFDDELVELALIKAVTRFNHYNFSKSLMEYRIILNKDFPESTMNNIYFSYATDELRDKKLKQLKKILGKRIKIL